MLLAPVKSTAAHTFSVDGASIISADCLHGAAGVCIHPSHTFSLLFDASRWSTVLLLDDGCRAWPLQLDASAFRRIIELSFEEDGALVEWVTHVVTTGDVPHIKLDRSRPKQQLCLESALVQLRRQISQKIMEQFHMDTVHGRQQVADWMSVARTRVHSFRWCARRSRFVARFGSSVQNALPVLIIARRSFYLPRLIRLRWSFIHLTRSTRTINRFCCACIDG